METDKDMKKAAAGALARRQFLFDSAKMACGVGLLGIGLGLYAKQAKALPPVAIRPPGALSEKDFLGACIRCGLLDHKLTDINKAKMGLAVLVDQETCLNFLGLRCDVCYRVCPVIDKAITLEERINARTGKHALFIPVVHSEHCTGCGKCEKACVLDVAAIKVYPTQLAKGELGKHYRLGWVEQEKAGGSLVAPDVEHRYNLPEGLQYDPRRGLSPSEPVPAIPGDQPAAPKALQGGKL